MHDILRFLRFLFLLLLIASIIIVGAAYYIIRFSRPGVSATAGPSGEVVFVVEPGESTAEIARHLADQGLIRSWIIPSEWVFRFWVWVRGMDGQLEAGRYILQPGMTMDEILGMLTQAPGAPEITFRIPEGSRLEEVAETLEKQGVVSQEDFLAALQQPYDYAFLADRPEGASLEGYLFPDTYIVPRTYTAPQIVDFILQDFDQRFDQEMRDEVRRQGRTIYEVVTLASIIEREAVLDEERPIIASVYMNRLAAGMPLEADPTVQYAVGYNERQQKWWPVLYFDELGVETLSEVNSPYNTYRYPGLPPGPICSPRLTSLQAAVYPAETDYYFFVAKGDGSGEHAFARNIDEHNANVHKYRPQ